MWETRGRDWSRGTVKSRNAASGDTSLTWTWLRAAGRGFYLGDVTRAVPPAILRGGAVAVTSIPDAHRSFSTRHRASTVVVYRPRGPAAVHCTHSVLLTPGVRCHVSRVTCHVSGVNHARVCVLCCCVSHKLSLGDGVLQTLVFTECRQTAGMVLAG